MKDNFINTGKKVQIGSVVTIQYDGDIDFVKFKIVQSVSVDKPVWNIGKRWNRARNSNYSKAYSGAIGKKSELVENFDENTITSNSPIAKEILGKKQGDSFSVVVDGLVSKGKVISVL